MNESPVSHPPLILRKGKRFAIFDWNDLERPLNGSILRGYIYKGAQGPLGVASCKERKMTMDMELPGFRFHPTEEELLDFYLKNTLLGNKLRFDIIGFLNIYHHDPWDLPGLAKVGEREWYFLVPRDKKHGSGGRPNRTTQNGFWKATGSDRKIISLSEPKRLVGLRKTLVFYRGRAPRGSKTDWVMNEYRLPDSCKLSKDIVLCKIYRKATSLKELEQRAALELEPEEASTHHQEFDEDEDRKPTLLRTHHKIPDLQLPPTPLDWTHVDPFWTQLNSPWLPSLFNF